jgi:hypothetical protein
VSVVGRAAEVEKYRKLFIGTLVFAIPAFLVSMVLMYLPTIGDVIETEISTFLYSYSNKIDSFITFFAKKNL